MSLIGTIWRNPKNGARIRLQGSNEDSGMVSGYFLKPGTNIDGRWGRITRDAKTGGPRGYVLEEPNV